ncbi:MAG: putative Ig domain-containing protein [Rhodanobacteraceae bacterium]|nr:putative Ig domain-containing protein [Rhodanobacteraceae bacterium]
MIRCSAVLAMMYWMAVRGIDSLVGGDGFDILTGGESNDTLDGGAGNDVLTGGGGDDYILAGDGDDTITGGDGADTLIGGGGDDIIDGGAGNDIIDGGGGHDQYVWNAGSGNDRIRGLDQGDAIVKFGADVNKADLFVWKFGNDLVIERRNGNSVTHLVIENFGASTSAMGAFEFADGTRWTAADVLAVLNTGLNSDDVIPGYLIDETIVGHAGNDELHGGGGNDALDGGAGHDRLYGEQGNDTLSAGDDDDYVYGGDGDDVITGGAGNDILTGGTGNNTYVFGRGDGVDEITLESSTDRLEMSVGIDASQLSMARSGDDLLIQIIGGTEQVRVLGHFVAGSGLTAIQFAGGGAALTAADILLRAEGGGIANSQTGTSGDDLFVVDHPDDLIVEQAGGGTDTVNASNDYVLGNNVENLTLLGTFGWQGTGNALDNTIRGNAGSNHIDGAEGNDTAYGGGGDDVYFGIETIIENAGEGYDTVYVTNYIHQLADNVEQMIVNTTTSSNFNPDLYIGNAQANVIDVRSNRAAAIIDGGEGADQMIYGGNHSITFVVDNVGDVYSATQSLLTVAVESSLAGAQQLTDRVDNFTATAAVAVQVQGNARNNRIDLVAATAASSAAGGVGNDVYVLGNGATIVELAGEGTDRVEFVGINGQITLADNVEKLTLMAAAEAASGIGNALDNSLVGNAYNNTLRGGDGIDTLTGAAGNDSLYGDAGNDIITGGIGNDVLDGGIGDDSMTGGDGSDTYYVDSLADSVIETGTISVELDVVHASIDYSLGAGIENLHLTGAANAGTGNAQDNLIQGHASVNTLTGGLGNDLLRGGSGDDLYIYNLGDGSDRIEELLDEGIDTLRLGAGITTAAASLVRESGRILLRIAGQEIDLTIPAGGTTSGVEFIEFATGERWDVLALTQANNPPLPGIGFDPMQVLGGQAFQFVVPVTAFEDEAPAQLQLAVGAGGIPSWMTFNPGTRTFSGTPPLGVGVDYVIEIVATDSAGQHASNWLEVRLRNPVLGTAVANTLVGTAVRDAVFGYAGNDSLDGRGGADDLIGGAGNDTYIVDDENDYPIELVGEGIDLVQASVHFGLHDNVENLKLTGSAALEGFGNELDNVLTGNSGANILDGWLGNDTLVGGAGNDTMIGGEGDDIFVVTEAGDVVTEYANEGTDTVRSSRTYTLGADVENLELTGTTANSGTGNALANRLLGNSGNNTLSGLDGNDVLSGAAGNDTLNGGNGNDQIEGGAGTDTLTGGAGNDTYVMARGYGVDTVVENGAPSSNQDTVLLKPGVTYDQLWFRRPSGSNNLEILIIGTSDKIVIKNWYVGVNNRTELFRTESGGMALTADKVQALVTAMAALPTPTTGQTTLPASTRTQLNAVFAATWAPYTPPPQLAGDSDVAYAEGFVPLAVATPLLSGDTKRPLHDAIVDPGAMDTGTEVHTSFAKPVSRYGIKDPMVQPFDLVPESEVPDLGLSLAKPIRNDGIDKPILLPIGPVEEDLAFEQATATANDMLTRLLHGRNLSNDSSNDAASSARLARRSLVEDSIDFDDALFEGKPVFGQGWAARQWERTDVASAAAANQLEGLISAMAAFAPRPPAELLPSEHERPHVQPIVAANLF